MQFLGLLAFLQISIIYGNLVNFQEGYEYIYDYDGSTEMPNFATFYVKGKIGIVPHNKSLAGNQECLLYIHNFYMSVKTAHGHYSQDFGMDLTKSLLFDITPHGEVVSIKYPKNEHTIVIFLKKSLLGALSSKLIVTAETLKGNREWSYQINETGHDGKNEVTYNVQKSTDGLVFKRTKQFTEVPNAKGNRQKILHYHPTLEIPHLIKIEDSYLGPTEAPSHYNPHERFPGDPKKLIYDKDSNFKIPPMNAEGKSSLKFLEKRQLKKHILIKRSDILEDSLMISKYPEFKAPLNILEDEIKSNLTCVRTIKNRLNQTRNSCFVMLAKLLKEISNEDIIKVADIYLNETLTNPEDVENRAIMADAFGVVASQETLYYLTERILLSQKPNFQLIMSTLAQFTELYQPPPKIFLKTLELKNFKSPYKLSDAFETKLINDRALLVLGAVIHEMQKFDPNWSKQMTDKLESRLKIFDPWHHRQIRSALSDDEFDEQMDQKSLLILSLGNAAAETSRDYFKSYMNNSESPSLLRRSSIRALTSMHDAQAADLLLVAAITDAEEHVRYDAKNLYKIHPFAMKLHYTENEVLPDLRNLTSAEADNHVRRTRSISNVIRLIFQGFQVKIALPEYDWNKQIGSKAIGASFGLHIKNELDVDIKPLKGFLRVDVHDMVYAIAHLGFLNQNIDLVNAELCFKGGIEYDFNIFGEFSVDEIIDLVKSFDKTISNLINGIKNSIKQFKVMMETFGKTGLKGIIDAVIKTLQRLPDVLAALKVAAREILIQIARISDDAPLVFREIKALILRITNLYNDVKRDVTGFYNTIADTIQVVLPLASDQMFDGVSLIIEAIKQLMKDPKKAIGEIQIGIFKISGSILLMLDAKHKIEEAAFFLKGPRPNWMNLKAVTASLKTDILKLMEIFKKAASWVKEGLHSKDPLHHFTGTEIKKVKEIFYNEMKKVLEKVKISIEPLNELMEPFLKSFNAFVSLIRDIKDNYEKLRKAYTFAKDLIQKLFGPKFNKQFPRKYLESSDCGYGFYPSRGKLNWYSQEGVQVEVNSSQLQVVAPITGLLTKTGEYQVTITAAELKDTDIILENIKPLPNIDGEMIYTGELLGTVVRRQHCTDYHIHVVMRSTSNPEVIIDPSRYINKRKISAPKWVQHCNDYKLIVMNYIISCGRVTGKPKNDDISPSRIDSPDLSDLPSIPKIDKKEITNTIISFGKTLPKFDSTQFSFEYSMSNLEINPGKLGTNQDQLGLDKSKGVNGTVISNFFGKLKSILQKLNLKHDMFNMRHVTIKEIFPFLNTSKRFDLVQSITSILEKLDYQEQINRESCDDVAAFDIQPLKDKIVGKIPFLEGMLNGKKESSADNSKCPNLFNALPQNNNKYCQYSESCLTIACCMNGHLLNFLKITIKMRMSFNPCSNILSIGIDDWKHKFDITNLKYVREGRISPDRKQLNIIGDFEITYTIKRNGDSLTVSFAFEKCKSEKCDTWLQFLNKANMSIPQCPEGNFTEDVFDSKITIDISKYFHLTLGEIEEKMDSSNMNSVLLFKLMKYIRIFQNELLRVYLVTALSNAFENDFESFDICLNALSTKFKSQKIFFKVSFKFMVGPIPLKLGFEAGGHYEMKFHTTFCLLTHKLKASVIPEVGAQVSAYVAVGFLLYGELQLTGYILNLRFPTTAEISYKEFPFTVRIRMDLEFIPVRLELAGLCTVDLWFFRKTLFKALIWEYTATSITKNIFNHNKMKKDTQAPKFSMYRKQKINKLYLSSSSSSTTHCFVQQLKGRDYTDPAFLIEIDVEDDKSDVNIKLCVGTFNSGCDVLRDEPLAGSSVILAEKLVGGIPLHFTITATDRAGGSTKATCQLHTYDNTLPDARLVPSFLSTSHPNIIHGSATFIDDSPILIKKISVGFGTSMFGDQLIPWQYVGPTRYSAALKIMDSFTDGRPGHLIAKPIATSTLYSSVEECGKLCVEYSSQCLSFNYAKNNHLCEILQSVESDVIHLRQQADYYNYERVNTLNTLYIQQAYSGNTFNIRSNVLKLKHNELIYINAYLVNQLGYTNYISSAPIITDFTPPGTGPLGKIQDDRFFHDTCSQYIIEKWRSWCKGLTPLKNHRIVIDGNGAAAVFNGQDRMVDLLYTRANTFFSCHFHGFHDNETGILGYSWAYGTKVCETNILERSDPHRLVYDRSQWAHKGIAYPLYLPDGKYYLSIQAYNNIEFGGPLATTICHSVPLAIDNTPPILHYVNEPTYDEHSYDITMDYFYSDPESLIRDVSIAVGKTTHDTLLMDWETEAESNDTFFRHSFKIPDGIPAWIKIRAANNVDLRTSGHYHEPILVDTTPPLPGYVFDGNQHGIDIDFQNNNNEICVNWDDFSDPESAIGKYMWGVGSSPGLDNIINFQDCMSVVRHNCEETIHPLNHTASYYSTVIAFNNGHDKKNVSVTSNGVLYDATPPIKGWIYDGLDQSKSMKYSSDLSTVSANWNNYSDPESGIKEYSIKVYQRLNTTVELLKDSMVFSYNTKSISWHTFHFKHGDKIFVDLTTTNQALSSLITTSDGYTIDMTVPRLLYLGDGSEPGVNRQFSTSTTELVANYKFEDPESGIDHYHISVFEMFEGFKQIYPEGRNSFISVPSNVTIWKSEVPLILQKGALYSIRVSAFNGAGMSSVHNSDGVVIDPTSPIMEYVRIGVISGEAEDLIDDFVMVNDQSSIIASWRAIDPESGIVAYWISVGTSPGGQEVSNYHKFTNAEHGYINGLNLELFNSEINLPFYYITVKAENGAGLFSEPMISSKIKVVEGDIAGIVSDGPYADFINDTYVGIDIDYQLDSTSATTYFHGFRSVMHGIISYEWAVGTRPQLDDIQEYTSHGIVIDEGIESPGQGISGSGRAQSILHLQHGETYYITVRAITGMGKILESVSDGFTVDNTASMVSFINFGTDLPLPRVDTTHYQKSVDSLNAAWNITDEESEITSVIFYVGTYPGGSNIFNVSNSDGKNMISNNQVQPLMQGEANIITLVAENKVGLKTHAISGVTIVDITPPITGVINCSQFIRSFDEISCSWHNFYDFESGINNYVFSMGFTQDDDILLPAIQLTSNKTQFVIRGVQKHHRDHYLAKIIAINGVGLSSTSLSQEIIVDDSPPQGQTVVVLSSSTVFNATDPTLFSEITSIDCKIRDCSSLHAVCQKSLTDIRVVWESFIDLESPITSYEVAVGISPGGTQISGFTSVEDNKYYTTISNLDLSEISSLYVSVKGYNVVNLAGQAVSSQVFISHISSGLTPLGKSYVNDGAIIGKDIDFQYQNDYISAHWNFSGDLCPIIRYEWEIVKLDGSFVQNMSLIAGLETLGANDELDLYDGESYFVIVKSTNWLGYTYSLRSNGVTIIMDSLLPGNVRDGEAMGIDVNVQKSITSLSANWDGFGEPGKSHQVIDYYEVAAGNDQRYPGTRINIHPFINVGLNTSWTFNNLILLPRIGMYYITVRAYSITSARAQVTSNGVQVGIGGKSIIPGILEIPSFINSASHLIFSWSSFESEIPILWHIWGISSKDLTQEFLDCNQMQVFDQNAGPLLTTKHEELFDVLPLTKISKDMVAESSILTLKHGEMYDVVVIGTDEAAMCNYTVGKVTVDLTPPVKGKLKIGPQYDTNIMLSKEEISLTADWIEYYDPESGIESYVVSLYESIECPSENNKHPKTIRTTDEIKLHFNTSSYTFIDLQLKEYKSYFVHLVITNGAGISIKVISSPIIIDLQDPIFGDVKDGTDITNDETHQSRTDHLEGVFIYLDKFEGEACQLKTVNIPGKSNDWEKIVQEGIWGLPNIDINLQPEQIEVIDPVALSITLQRDLKQKKMVSGAIYTSAEIDHGSIFEIKIKAAGDFPNTVTSAVIWDGPAKVFGDFESTDESLNQTSGNAYYKKILYPSSSQENINFDVHLHQHLSSGVTESLKYIPQTGCGFQLHPNVSDGSKNIHMMFVWCQFVNHSSESSKAVVILDFDPVADWHTYSVHFNKEKLTIQEDWSLEMFIDENSVAKLTGIPKFSPDSKLGFSLWNRNNYLPEIKDIFSLPQTSAYFKEYKMPGSKSCRYANPFRNGKRAIQTFYAGVGSENSLDDLMPFTEIAHPCIPCINPCDSYYCDPSCDIAKVTEYHVNLTDLHLNTTMIVGNDTVPALYFLTVKAESGSGRSTVVSSNGIVIDVTPPIVKYLYALDLNWSEDQPINFQTSNSSITAKWTAYDLESDIIGYQWAIGTSPKSTDIQDFVNVGLNEKSTNDKLLGILQDKHTYYITVKTINGAHLETYEVTDVTVTLSDPNMSNTTAKIIAPTHASCEDNDTVVFCYDRSTLGVIWDRVPDDAINSYYFGVGSSEENLYDVIPERLVGINKSETVIITDGQLLVSGESISNISDLLIKENSNDTTPGLNRFSMEPGRILYVHVKACTMANKCGAIPVKPLIYFNSDYQIARKKSGEDLYIIKMEAPAGTIKIEARSGDEKVTVVAGMLQENDLRQSYVSDASNDFKPYISKTWTTVQNTSRSLLGRIKKWLDTNFFISILHEQQFKILINLKDNDPNALFKLLYWDTEREVWSEADKTCGSSRIINNISNVTQHFMVCQKVHSVHYSLALLQTKMMNSPPILLTFANITLLEDSDQVCIQVEAYDPDGDDIHFLPETHLNSYNIGSASISLTGYLCFTPFPDLFGTENFHFKITEFRNDSETSLSIPGKLTFVVLPQNDNPVLMVIRHGIQQIPTIQGDIEYRLSNADYINGFIELLVAYDIDDDDSVNILVSKPENGYFIIYKEFKNITFAANNCLKDVSTNLHSVWNTVLQKNDTSLLLPYPCNWNLRFDLQKVVWAFTLLHYIPNNKFTGTDTIKAIAKDKEMALSDYRNFKLDIIYNPCQNGGSCYDTYCLDMCTAPLSCVCLCPKRYTGSYCEIKMCPGEEGHFPNPLNCTTYFQCDFYSVYIRNCPKGLVFNPRNIKCDFPKNVPECKDYYT